VRGAQPKRAPAVAEPDQQAPVAPGGTPELPPVSAPPEAEAFFDEPDGPWRDALVIQPIKRVERGRGGRSLGFKITLADGHKGYFKPDQTFSAANWFGEVASFHLDRMLGLGRVPCVASREFTWTELVGAAGRDPRKDEVLVTNGKVRGAFVAWVGGGLAPLPEEPGWERWVRVKYWPSTSVSPFSARRSGSISSTKCASTATTGAAKRSGCGAATCTRCRIAKTGPPSSATCSCSTT
jgi:hypothetical protein